MRRDALGGTALIRGAVAGWSPWRSTYGLLLAGLSLLALLSGRLRMDIHGFGAVLAGQAVWLIALGLELRRDESIGPA